VRSSKKALSWLHRAKVKWVQNLGAKGGFQVAVELEVCWQYWGIATRRGLVPARVNIASDTSNTGRKSCMWLPGRNNRVLAGSTLHLKRSA